MSEEVWKEIGFFALVFAIVFGLWVFTGGPHRVDSQAGIFIKPLPPEGSGAIYGAKPIATKSLQTTTIITPTSTPSLVPLLAILSIATTTPRSTYSSFIAFDGTAHAGSAPSSEYLRLVDTGDSDTPIDVSGFSIENSSVRYGLPLVEKLLIPGTTTPMTNILMNKDSDVIVATGPSPVGANFQVNICMGLLNGSGLFTPAFPSVANGDQNLTYTACVAKHENDADFYVNEWRVFLSSNATLWKSSLGSIHLLDRNGYIIDKLDL